MRPEEFSQAEELVYQAKFNEAVELINNLEKTETKDSIDQLQRILLQGKIHCYLGQYKKATDIGEIAYQLSQKLEPVIESVDALLLKAHVIYLGNTEESSGLIKEAERIFESFKIDSSSAYYRKQADILLMKSMICLSKGNLNEAFGLAEQCLTIRQNLNKKLDLSNIYYHLGRLYHYKSDSKLGLEYASKSLTIHEELKNQTGIASSLFLVGVSYFSKGDFDQALKLCKQSLKIKEISILTKLEVLGLLALIYLNRGQLDRAIRYRNEVAEIAQKEQYSDQLIISTYGVGVIYRAKGKFDLATNYLKKSLDLSKKFNSPFAIQTSLFYLILTSLDNNSLEKAKIYLNQLEQFSDQTESGVFKNVILISKALVLKNSARIRNLSEAELMLKKFTEKEIETPILYHLALVNLCEIFLEELKFTNNPEILDELSPLISKIYEIAENQNAYTWLVDTKLLQAKLALIQMDFDRTKQLLTHAQRIAELHGLTFFALKISSEHDNLLEQLNEWNNLKNSNAPMSERIELASFDGVVNRMQGKSTIEPPILTPEIPVLLLIIGEGGFPLFSNQFEKSYSIEEDLLSGFLAAFNTFTGELFSKGLDRVKFGEYMLLMQAVKRFSVCYLFKGQTYMAKQKLTQFTEKIQNDELIWGTLKIFYDTSRVVKPEDLPSLVSLILEIFY
ncbi:MAG: tetratricopeptide repeat protein [Promethearchaeota archaeon]